MSITLPYNFQPRDYQIPLWEAIFGDKYRRGVTVWPRRNGKDLIYWNACIAKAMQRVGLYFYIAPYYNQVRHIIWEGADKNGRRFLDYIPRELIAHKTQVDMRIELVNGSIIKLLGSDVVDRIVGTNPICIFFTEFSLHKPEAWEYLRPILAENEGEAWFNGTPRGLNHFYKMFEMSKRDPLWYTQYLTRDDTGIPTDAAIREDRLSGMPESLIQQEYYVEWTASTEDTLIPLDIVKPCLDAQIHEQDYNFKPRIMGVDVAYAIKGDKSCIAKRQGRYLHPIRRFQGADNMALATEVSQEINTWHPDAVFIDAGRGEGVISRLWNLGYGDLIVPVHFSGTSYSDLYMNKRAEIWCKMRDWFMEANTPSIPHDDDLVSDMTSPTFWTNDRGFIQLESKKDIKKRLKRSPDAGDSVALTFAEEIESDQFETREATQAHKFLETLRRRTDVADNSYDVLNHLNQDRYNFFCGTGTAQERY